jgi:6-phosphogluconolactonase/glucosamine-6-phosphate isomerase/deaminase
MHQKLREARKFYEATGALGVPNHVFTLLSMVAILSADFGRLPYGGKRLDSYQRMTGRPELNEVRSALTLTYPTLESSRHTAFIVAGKEKRAIFDGLHRGDDSLPAARLHPIAADGIPLRPVLVHT